MTISQRPGTTRRAALAKARQSRRPSRLGSKAGAAPEPDRILDSDAGFPSLLKEVWRTALAAPDLAAMVNVLLTLDGHVPADVQLRALASADEVALEVLCGISWRDEDPPEPPPGQEDQPAIFLGELGLSTSGRIVLRVPSQPPLANRENLVDSVVRVPWSAAAVTAFHDRFSRVMARAAVEVADCRRWLAAAGPDGREQLLELLKEAARRTAPFVLYQEAKQYTNFRDLNTLTGKTLWPGHPDCALSSLHNLPLALWSDNDAVLVVCLALLVRSASFARIEEANGTQLSVGHVSYLLERTRRKYNLVPGGQKVPRASSARVQLLAELADQLRERRGQISGQVQLYREIHGALMHKIEQVAGPWEDAARRHEQALCARLQLHLPVTGASLDELATELARDPQWLAHPHDGFGTGLESLVYHTVSAATSAFEADFAMSRGMRSLPRLIQALREQSWAEITKWEITDYFCCVVPAVAATRHFSDSIAALADISWAISSRMQYNSWHFVPGNLPKVSAVQARDHFVPPSIPDVAFFSDQHHHGHVAAHVRYSIRSPQPVTVLDRVFKGFLDLRLLRCEGPAFDEQDLLAAHRTSAFLATATSLAAELVAAGAELEVEAFDSQWHRDTIAALAATGPAGPPGSGQQV